MQADTDIVSLNYGFTDLVPSSDDISLDELKMTTTDALIELSEDSFTDLKKRFKKIHYTILDRSKNRKGFGLTEDALITFVDHYNQTKDMKELHNFYKDHDYRHVDSMMGKIVSTTYDAKNQRVRRTALIDLRHPTAKRLDMFKSLSATIMHGKPVCSSCNAPFRTCDHIPDGDKYYPESTVAYGVEDSIVTIPAYSSAKRDSLNVFAESLSAIDISSDVFESLSIVEEKEIADKDKLAAESLAKEKATAEALAAVRAAQDNKTAKTMKELRDSITALKDILNNTTAI